MQGETPILGALKLPVKLYVEDDSLIPTKGTEFSAGYDLRAKHDYIVEVGKTTYIGTGVFIELCPGYEAQIRSRSGLSTKQGLILVNGIATIDSDYRGELIVGMTLLEGYQKSRLGQMTTITSGSFLDWPSAAPQQYHIKKGDKIAQMVLSRCYDMNVTLVSSVDELSKTARDKGGFNSTGR